MRTAVGPVGPTTTDFEPLGLPLSYMSHLTRNEGMKARYLALQLSSNTYVALSFQMTFFSSPPLALLLLSELPCHPFLT